MSAPTFSTRSMVARGTVVALVAALLLGAGLVSASAAGAARSEKFNLVVEGHAYAARTFSVSGDVSVCEESASGTFSQYDHFARGKGVALEFVRRRKGSGFQYGIRRLGASKTQLTVVDIRERAATGSAEVHNAKLPFIPVSCPENGVKHELDEKCPEKHTVRPEVGLKLEGTSFSVVSVEDALRAPVRSTGMCGETLETKGLLELDWEWPDFVPVDAAPIPEAKLFSGVSATAVHLSGKKEGEAQKYGAAPFEGTSTDKGETDITVRFIRCGAKHLPACD